MGAHSTRPLGQVSNGSQRVGAQDEPTVEGPIPSPGRETEAHTAPRRRRACARSWSGTTRLPPAFSSTFLGKEKDLPELLQHSERVYFGCGLIYMGLLI